MGFLDTVIDIMKRFAAAPTPTVGVESDQHSHLPGAESAIEPNSVVETDSRAGTVFLPVAPTVTLEQRTRDRRQQASKKHDYGQRPWTRVTGICLHQTACVLGESPARWDTVGCHAGVTRGGQVIRLHGYDRLVVHGNGWNAQCVGIEIDGTYEGVEGDERTFWRAKGDTKTRPQRLTTESVEAACQLIRSIRDEVALNGGRIGVIVAHRQASENRRNDPGSEIWRRVAIPMMRELGLEDGGRGFKIGSGYPIPEAWDPTRKGIKY